MIIQTSNFAKCWDNPKAVAISIGVPKGWVGKRYWKLAPAHAMMRMSIPDFTAAYRKKLADLRAADIIAEIQKYFGDDVILLCFEQVNVKCHRRLVAEWLEENTGIEVTELGLRREDVLCYDEAPDKAGQKVVKKNNVDLFGNFY